MPVGTLAKVRGKKVVETNDLLVGSIIIKKFSVVRWSRKP